MASTRKRTRIRREAKIDKLAKNRSKAVRRKLAKSTEVKVPGKAATKGTATSKTAVAKPKAATKKAAAK